MRADPRAPVTRIVLVGLMASGKTLVGSVLARRLAWRYLVADLIIDVLARTPDEVAAAIAAAIDR